MDVEKLLTNTASDRILVNVIVGMKLIAREVIVVPANLHANIAALVFTDEQYRENRNGHRRDCVRFQYSYDYVDEEETHDSYRTWSPWRWLATGTIKGSENTAPVKYF